MDARLRRTPFFLWVAVIYSSLAQSVERMTVNHDVVGSSPTGGAKKKALAKASAFFNEAHLRCMKNEAGLRPMKRAFGT